MHCAEGIREECLIKGHPYSTNCNEQVCYFMDFNIHSVSLIRSPLDMIITKEKLQYLSTIVKKTQWLVNWTRLEIAYTHAPDSRKTGQQCLVLGMYVIRCVKSSCTIYFEWHSLKREGVRGSERERERALAHSTPQQTGSEERVSGNAVVCSCVCLLPPAPLKCWSSNVCSNLVSAVHSTGRQDSSLFSLTGWQSSHNPRPLTGFGFVPADTVYSILIVASVLTSRPHLPLFHAHKLLLWPW